MGDQLPVFVINLRRAPERKERMTALLAAMGIPAQIHEAVDGRLLDVEGHAYWNDKSERRLLNPGEIGCLLSHIAVWRRIVEEDLPFAVVLEDDLCFAPGFGSAVRAAAGLARIDLLKLETDFAMHVVVDSRPVAEAGDHACHRLRGGAHRTGGYMVSRQAAQRLLAAAPSFRYAVDVEMFDRRRSAIRELIVHQLTPAVCVQAELRPNLAGDADYLQSAIQTMGKRSDSLQGLDRSREAGIMRSLRRMLRPVKHFVACSVLTPIGRLRGPIPFAGDAATNATEPGSRHAAEPLAPLAVAPRKTV